MKLTTKLKIWLAELTLFVSIVLLMWILTKWPEDSYVLHYRPIINSVLSLVGRIIQGGG